MSLFHAIGRNEQRETWRCTASAATLALRFLVVAVFMLGATLLLGCSSTPVSDSAPLAIPRSGAGVEPSTDSDAETDDTMNSVLVVASSYNHVPFESKTGMEPEGFSIELVKLIAEEMGIEVQFTDPVRDASALPDLLPGAASDVAAKVAAGEATVGLSSIRASAALESSVATTDIYLPLDLALVVRADGDVGAVADVPAGTVAVQSDGTAAQWAAENLPHGEIALYDDPNEALSALVSGSVVASVVDEPVVQRFRQVKAPGRLEVIASAPVGDGFVMVVENRVQANKVNAALVALRKSGAYDDLWERWFGEPSQRGDAGPYTRMPDGQGDTAFSNN